MGIFKVEKRDLSGNLVESYVMNNTILDAGMEYLCGDGNNFNAVPSIGVGESDITPDINQADLILPVIVKSAVFTPGSEPDVWSGFVNGDKQFSSSVTFEANEALGYLSELAYYMNNRIPLNRTLFQTPGKLDTKLILTPELDQLQIADISNSFQVYGNNFFDQTFTVGASGGTTNSVTNLTEIELSLASSGFPISPLLVQIYNDNSGQPGSLLGTSTIPTFAEPVQRWRTFQFTPSISVSGGNMYHIVTSCEGTNATNCYDLFGSFLQEYFYGTLSVSASGGTGNYTLVNPMQDLGFKTYYNISDNISHDYVLTSIQFECETTQSPDFNVVFFPENNLDSTNTSQGTVRLTIPIYTTLPMFTSAIKIYKKVIGAIESPISYNLLAQVGTIRQYFYDNGTIIPNATKNPPIAASVVTTPTGLTAITDTTNGGSLQIGLNRFYSVSAILQGPVTNNITVGPYAHNGVYLGNPPVIPWYSNATGYSTTPMPLFGTEYETTASAEYTLVAPTTSNAAFTEYFNPIISNILNPTLWNITNTNQDYFGLINSTNGTQLQMNIPGGSGSPLSNNIPFVISSTRQVRPGQSYFINVKIPLSDNPPPFYIYPGGTKTVHPVYTNQAPNRVSIFSFVNPSQIQSQNNDKRLSFEYGFYDSYRLETWVLNNWSHDTWGDNSTGDPLYANRLGPCFALYDNIGNVYIFNKNDIPKAHADGTYTFRIDINQDCSMEIYALNPNRTFTVIQSTVETNFNFTTQFNADHYYNYQTQTRGGLPGPTTQTTNHFKIPQTYSFAIGTPSKDPLVYSDLHYVSVKDALYTIPGLNPASPVPAIAMTVNQSITPTAGGMSAIVTWNPVKGARKYRLYRTNISGNYNTAPNDYLVYDYETYFPTYAVQSIETPNNDWTNGLLAVGNSVRNWQDIGVTYAQDASTTGTFNSYAMSSFIGSNSVNFGNPNPVPTIATAPGTAEQYLLIMSLANELVMFTFMGGGCEIVADIGPNRGIGAVYIDGNFSQNVDFYSSERLAQQSVWNTTMPPGYHTIMVHCTLTSNPYSIGTSIALDYFHITVPAIVDSGTVSLGNPSTTDDPNIAPVFPPPIKSAKTYSGNGPTTLLKDPQHSLSIEMIFELSNPNIT